MALLNRKQTDAPPLARPKRGRIGEITSSWANIWTGIRRRGLWPTAVQYASGSTKLTYALARALYRNDQADANLGAGFCKRIVNSIPDFMGLPMSATGDEIIDEFLNACMHTYWRAEIHQLIRDGSRDADVVVRVRRHDPENPLVTPDEWESCYLEIVPPETCAIYYKQMGDKSEIEAAYIRHETDEVVERASANNTRVLNQPITRPHVIIEEITPDSYRYYDETTGAWRDDLEEINDWGFVPLVEGFNEYDAGLEGGQSEFESPLPFIMAFHDVMSQTLVSHKAHSIPKAKFKVNDMMNFISNNWPESFDTDETGQPILDSFDGSISWKGTEMLFFDAEGEDAEFLEVKAGNSGSKELLDFLLTCISISSETPKSILMDQTVQDADEMVPFSKKINRKRSNWTPTIQMVCKMVLAINFMPPTRVPLSWEEITPDLALKKSQTLQQDVMSMETLATRQVISDDTIRKSLRRAIPAMKSGSQEKADAKKNVDLLAAAGGGGGGAPVSPQSTSGSDAGNKKQAGRPN